MQLTVVLPMSGAGPDVAASRPARSRARAAAATLPNIVFTAAAQFLAPASGAWFHACWASAWPSSASCFSSIQAWSFSLSDASMSSITTAGPIISKVLSTIWSAVAQNAWALPGGGGGGEVLDPGVLVWVVVAAGRLVAAVFGVLEPVAGW